MNKEKEARDQLESKIKVIIEDESKRVLSTMA